MAAEPGARRIVEHCAGLRAGERALVLCDPATRAVGDALLAAARALTEDAELLEIPPLRMHGEEPPHDAARRMLAADVVFGATAFSLAHARARGAATDRGARYLSLPDLTPERLASSALVDVDFRALTPVADAYAARLGDGRALHLTSRAGTDLRCVIAGRPGNAAPGWTDAPGGLASPPDAEANVPPVEDGTEGVIVVDGSIPHPDFGLLDAPIELVVRGGRVVDVAGPRAAPLRALLAADPANAVVAEIGLGLNPRARLTGAMLEDEGCAGTVHVGIGGNTGLGGANAAPFHLDHVLRAPTLDVDGERLVDAGRLALCPDPPSP
jgi:leucyl aminopeptidase (aminopeptidase T)